ncbi:hypothetical protein CAUPRSCDRAFT_11353 [Caulochytrium protostelioides]|uniref:Secreted protein n=1 Tax=Caulochytrium protostelioides TaxID=1555241 RepID=A0A4P9WW86_9FUNG|nr:hypothetical protein CAUPRSCDRAFT_11353 [Caulochytrium protostelioides]
MRVALLDLLALALIVLCLMHGVASAPARSPRRTSNRVDFTGKIENPDRSKNQATSRTINGDFSDSHKGSTRHSEPKTRQSQYLADPASPPKRSWRRTALEAIGIKKTESPYKATGGFQRSTGIYPFTRQHKLFLTPSDRGVPERRGRSLFGSRSKA